eukprot:TRINITY_DN12371_c0_g1_i3.p1 TRINITY_DN12371_c0_g1~~TRINITY_DN12371_c0_g1_i3.p1  ORF type:complete len:326 (-),score=39.67 TRINITY_DN12371_c0_g1_i3:184-1161(-)
MFQSSCGQMAAGMLRALARGRGATLARPAPSVSSERVTRQSFACVADAVGHALGVQSMTPRTSVPTSASSSLLSTLNCGAAGVGGNGRDRQQRPGQFVLALPPSLNRVGLGGCKDKFGLGCGWMPAATLGSVRAFGIKKVRQRRRSRGRIIQAKQHHYEPKPDGYRPLPLSLLGSGPVRRVLMTGTEEAKRLAGMVDWERYKSDHPGVRWHPVGGWRVQFDRRDYEHNFYVKCDCYFRVGVYGFDRAKHLAMAYRSRLEAEWEEQQRIWYDLDSKREARRLEKRAARQRAKLEESGEGALVSGDDGQAWSIAGLPALPGTDAQRP